MADPVVNSTPPATPPPAAAAGEAPKDSGSTAAAGAPPPKEGTPPPAAAADSGKPVVPEKYDLKIPKDSLLKEGAIQRISDFAKSKGLTNEQAQSLLENEDSAIKSFNDGLIENHNKTVEGWVDTVKADKEIGGDGYAKNVELASRVAKKFGDEEFLKDLTKSGYGNHPGLVKMMVRIGKAMSEDQLVIGGSAPKAKVPLEDKLYGSPNKP